MKQIPLAIGPESRPSFANFVPGANAAALQHLASLSLPSAPVYLWGPAASGKTHLMQALVARCQAAGQTAAWFDAADPEPWTLQPHWALVVAAGLSHPEAGILHNAWLGYDRDWIPRSRGTNDDDLAAGWASLHARGLADGDVVNADGIALRQRIEDDTDRLTTLPWELLGEERSRWFADVFEPPCELLLRRVDETADPNYQPASRIHRRPG